MIRVSLGAFFVFKKEIYMVSLVWQFVAFLIGMMAAGWLLFIIGTFFVVLVGTIAKYIKKS